MINLKPNANQIINQLAYEDGVRAFYFSVCERYANGYTQLFITDFQSLITKLGIIISKASTNERNISYCAQSISYLCNDVLDNPNLENTLNSLGINYKGNRGKHDIITNRIDLDRCVSTYNNIVNTISIKYKLPALNAMVVSKRLKHSTSSTSMYKQQPSYKPTNLPTKKKQIIDSHPDETATTNDERLRLSAELTKGDGRYTKGIFYKTNMVNFVINVSIKNPDNLKISSVTAIFKCGSNVAERKLSTESRSKTKIDLETSKFSGNIEASVIVVYKLSLFKTKQIKATVSKNF